MVNSIVHQYLIPGVQIGTKVQLCDDGKILDIFNVVRPMNPGEGCLWCNQLISPARLQEEALTPEQRRQQRYVDDDEAHAPSVITLNAVGAAHAVNDYLIRIVGLVAPDWDRRWTRLHPIAPNAVDRVPVRATLTRPRLSRVWRGWPSGRRSSPSNADKELKRWPPWAQGSP